MIFEKDYLKFNIIDVLHLDQGNVNAFNKGRRFDALTLRLSSDAVLRHGDREIVTSDGAVCFVPAGLDYRRAATRDDCLVIHFTLDAPLSQNVDMTFPKDPDRVEKLFWEILDVWHAKGAGYKYKAAALVYEIFAECHVEAEEEKKSFGKICEGVKYINLNFKKYDVSVSEAAKRCFMSEAYFRKLFRAEFGTSPRKYIIKSRIQNAASLIDTGYYLLKEVADMCGYTDYKYFSVEFKSVMGKSPSEYAYKFQQL